MLRIERDDRTFTVVSDDANGENAALDEAIEDAAPHLHDDFRNTPFEDGALRWSVGQEDWTSLLEVMDSLAAQGMVNPDDVEEIYSTVDQAVKEAA